MWGNIFIVLGISTWTSLRDIIQPTTVNIVTTVCEESKLKILGKYLRNRRKNTYYASFSWDGYSQLVGWLWFSWRNSPEEEPLAWERFLVVGSVGYPFKSFVCSPRNTLPSLLLKNFVNSVWVAGQRWSDVLIPWHQAWDSDARCPEVTNRGVCPMWRWQLGQALCRRKVKPLAGQASAVSKGRNKGKGGHLDLVSVPLSARMLEWCPCLQAVQKRALCQIWPEGCGLLISVVHHLQQSPLGLGSSCPQQWPHISTLDLLPSISCLTASSPLIFLK